MINNIQYIKASTGGLVTPEYSEESLLGKFHCFPASLYYISNINRVALSSKFELGFQGAKNYVSAFWDIDLNCSHSSSAPCSLCCKEP